MNNEPDLIWKSSALFGAPLTLGARGKLPLLPPPVGGTGCDKSDDADFNSKESVTTEEQQALALKHIEEWVSVLQRDGMSWCHFYYPLTMFLLM